MKKNSFHYLSKIVVIIFGFCLVLYTCQRDEYPSEIENEQNISSQPPDFESIVIPINSVFKEKHSFKRHIRNYVKADTAVGKSTVSSNFGFSIDTSFVIKITTNSYESYSFKAMRDSETPNELENFIITY